MGIFILNVIIFILISLLATFRWTIERILEYVPFSDVTI